MKYYKNGTIEINPSISDISNTDHNARLDAGWKPVEENKPTCEIYEELVVDTETETEDKYVIDYKVVHKSDSEIREMRQKAYSEEADGIFFQAQRNNEPQTMTDWENKVDEIKNRYPKEGEV